MTTPGGEALGGRPNAPSSGCDWRRVKASSSGSSGNASRSAIAARGAAREREGASFAFRPEPRESDRRRHESTRRLPGERAQRAVDTAGARCTTPAPGCAAGKLHRCKRQKVLLRAMLAVRPEASTTILFLAAKHSSHAASSLLPEHYLLP
jgi:hypothetical protein